MNIAQFRDFPDWVGPMLVKELRQGLKARGFEVTFVSLQVILALVVAYHALLYAKHGAGFDASGLHSTFWFLVGVQLLVITPLRALGGLTNERKANTLELIFMTGLSSWRIAWGKWASLFFQTLLFVLAVLPYGVLRYFFGGVNLIDDFITLGGMLLASAVFSSVALAISGLPAFFRVVAMGGFGLFGLVGLQGIFVAVMFSRSGGGPFSGMSFTSSWPLFVFNALLVCVGALAIGASTIAPVAENHALRQRLIALCAWLPVPLLIFLNTDETVIVAQLTIFVVLGLAVSWAHLAAVPMLVRVHLERFSRRGPAGLTAGLFFQPGWPSAVLFLSLVEILFVASLHWADIDQENIQKMTAVSVMAGAALMTAPLMWRLLRIPSRHTLVAQTLFLALSGVLFALLEAVDGVSMGSYQIAAIFPPLAFLIMLDGGLNQGQHVGWLLSAAGVFVVFGLLLLVLARTYWAQVFALNRDIRGNPKREPVPLEVAA